LLATSAIELWREVGTHAGRLQLPIRQRACQSFRENESHLLKVPPLHRQRGIVGCPFEIELQWLGRFLAQAFHKRIHLHIPRKFANCWQFFARLALYLLLNTESWDKQVSSLRCMKLAALVIIS
jgi:hypothetical protein